MQQIRSALSLFNGISGLHLALDKAQINVEQVYYSEIDKFANKVTEQHYPSDIALGDVTKWREWDIDWSSVDLVSAGFPCQAWSVAGKQLGDKDERGMLFWTTLEIIAHVLKHNPKAKFLMENVKMKKDFEEYITHHTTKALGYVEKTLINSALVSAQNRQRYYWTNFEVAQPDDKGIVLADILEDEEVNAYYDKGGNHEQNLNNRHRHLVFICGLSEGVRLQDGKRLSRNYREGYRIYSIGGKSACLTAQSKGGKGGYSGLYGTIHNGIIYYRKLTPLECERLQTVPDNWTECLSNTQRYKSLGNGWTIDVIVHILECAFK